VWAPGVSVDEFQELCMLPRDSAQPHCRNEEVSWLYGKEECFIEVIEACSTRALSGGAESWPAHRSLR